MIAEGSGRLNRASITDTHFHIFGPYRQFPLPPGANCVPGEATTADYLLIKAKLGIERMVVIQGSCYGTDNAIVLDAIGALGPTSTRGVAIIDDSFDTGTLYRLHDRGIRGIRLNLVSDRSIDADVIRRRARSVADLGWNVLFHCKPQQLVEYAPLLRDLPVPVAIDHFGRIDPGLGTTQPALEAMLPLLERGRSWVKLITYRSAHGVRADNMRPLVERVLNAAPERCIWGTDWPHPLFDGSADTEQFLDLICRWLPSEELREMVLRTNASALYDFP